MNQTTSIEPPSTKRWSGLSGVLRRGFTFAASAYIVLLVGYLVLRITIGDGVWWLAFLNAFAHFLFMPLIVIFPLAILLDKRSAFRLMPLVLVAGLWFVPYFSAKAIEETVDPTLRIMTFNIWGDNPHMADVEAWIRDNGADVVLLQEIPESYSEHGFPTLLDVYPYQFVQPLAMRMWGNAILSRVPFGETENFSLDGSGLPTDQRVTVDWNGAQIAVYNIHLLMPMGDEAHFSTPINNPFLHLALKYDDSLRDAEIARLVERLDAEKLPFVMGGDFNMSDQSMVYWELAARGRDSFREVSSSFGASWPVPVGGELPTIIPPLIRIDYIWHSDTFRAIEAQQGPPLGSDHLALRATLALNSSQ
jgi:endonuclease/exonuclease/phosphatase (EEP) superfamily protein YafD